MQEMLKQRLVGAVVLASLAVIFIPMMLAPAQRTVPGLPGIDRIHEAPTDFNSQVSPLGMAPDDAVIQVNTPELPGVVTREPLVVEIPGSDAGTPDQSARAPLFAPDPEPAPGARVVPPSPAVAAPVAVLQPRVGENAWIVQLGSFAKQDNARTLEARLRGDGYSAFVEQIVTASGSKVFRVRVGPELLRERAEKIRATLEKKLKLKGIVLRYH